MKKINVTQSSMPSFDEYVDEIKELWETKWLTNMGSKHQVLESQLKDYLAVDNIKLFTNGHLALEAVIEAMALKGEVITTPYTFASTTHAIVRQGLTPIFCDIDPNSYTIDVNKIEALITENTTAIIPVHVYGNICDIEAIDKIAKKYNLKVIYDAAHTFGVKYKGKGIGVYGDASMFSFHATKVFNTIEGGAVVFNDNSLSSKLDRLKNFGIASQECVSEVAGNAKMNEFQAAMGLCNLRNVDNEIGKRKKVYERYILNLKNVIGIKLLEENSEVIGNYAYFPIVLDGYKKNRNELFDDLQNNGVFARKYFYPLTSDFDCYKHIEQKKDTPIARRISESVLTLPLYSDLEMDDVDYICNLIKK